MNQNGLFRMWRWRGTVEVDIVTRNNIFRIYTCGHTRQKVSHSACKLTVKGQLALVCLREREPRHPTGHGYSHRAVYKHRTRFYSILDPVLNLGRDYTMPPTPRERFNAKARRSVAGGGSHKKKKIKKPNKDEAEGQEHPDANAEILVELPKEEKEQHRRELLRQEVCLVVLWM